MKNIVLLLLIFYSSVVFSQRFTFDFVTKYEIKYKDSFFTETIYSNTKVANIFFSIYKSGNTISALLIDINKEKYHVFKVIEKKENGQSYFSYKYKKTIEFTENDVNQFKGMHYKFEEIEKDSFFTKVLLTIVYDLKNPIEKSIYELKIKESDQNYFPNFRVAVLHPYENLKNFDRFKNGLVVESVQIRDGERVYPSKLVHSEQVALELIVLN